MSTLQDIIDITLLEKKDPVKIFYNIDVFIQEFKNDEEGKETEKAEASQAEKQGSDEEDANTDTNESTINEAIFKKGKKGVIELTEDESESILTINDLVDFLNDEKAKGKRLLSAISSELLLIMSNSSDDGNAIEDVVNEGDKIKIIIDYGPNKSNSIGVFLNKKSGSNAISFLMRKDGKNLGAFNLKIFEQRLLMFSRM